MIKFTHAIATAAERQPVSARIAFFAACGLIGWAGPTIVAAVRP